MKKYLLTFLFLSLPVLAEDVGFGHALTVFDRGQYDRAAVELNALSAQGHAFADYYLGKMYYEGLGVPKDEEKAFTLLKNAYTHRVYPAGFYLYKIFRERDPNNTKQALVYLKRAALAGDVQALEELGDLHMDETSITGKEYTYAFGYYLIGARIGDKKSQRKVALLYKIGRGATQDIENAERWMKRSAHQGYVLAQQDLADWYENDEVLKNPLNAYTWYSIIAAYNTDKVGEEAKEKRAEFEKKLEKKKEFVERQRGARRWRPTTALESVPDIERYKAPMPVIPGFNDTESLKKLLGEGDYTLVQSIRYNITPEDIAIASSTQDFAPLRQKVTLAAHNGAIGAYAYYGDLMANVFRNDTQATMGYKKGAEAGDTYAQYRYAKALCSGTGLENADIPRCYAWLLYAYKNTDELLKPTLAETLTFVEENSTPEEQAKGKELVDEVREIIEDKKTVKENKPVGEFTFF